MTNKTTLTVAVHNSTFHTDDVFACATLQLAFPDTEIRIVRTRDEEAIRAADIAVDVGGIYDPSLKRFDHHQIGGAGVRDNDVPFASFGLVWKEYGSLIAGEVEAKRIDELFVQPIDAHDTGYSYGENTKHEFAIGDTISLFRPAWKEERDIDASFLEAVGLARTILERLIIQTRAYILGRNLAVAAYEAASSDKRIVVMEEEYPGWQEVLIGAPEPYYAVYQRNDGQWSVKGVSTEHFSFMLRKPFPEAWAGLRDEALATVTGVEDSVFCHTNRFLVVARSKEGALALAQRAVES